MNFEFTSMFCSERQVAYDDHKHHCSIAPIKWLHLFPLVSAATLPPERLATRPRLGTEFLRLTNQTRIGSTAGRTARKKHLPQLRQFQATNLRAASACPRGRFCVCLRRLVAPGRSDVCGPLRFLGQNPQTVTRPGQACDGHDAQQDQ